MVCMMFIAHTISKCQRVIKVCWPDAYGSSAHCGAYTERSAPPELNNVAVVELCTRTISAQTIAQSVGVCRPTLYNWKNQLLGREASASMKRHKDSGPIPKQKDLTELQQHVALLERDIRRLQLEHDLLKKANELLKKAWASPRSS